MGSVYVTIVGAVVLAGYAGRDMPPDAARFFCTVCIIVGLLGGIFGSKK